MPEIDRRPVSPLRPWLLSTGAVVVTSRPALAPCSTGCGGVQTLGRRNLLTTRARTLCAGDVRAAQQHPGPAYRRQARRCCDPQLLPVERRSCFPVFGLFADGVQPAPASASRAPAGISIKPRLPARPGLMIRSPWPLSAMGAALPRHLGASPLFAGETLRRLRLALALRFTGIRCRLAAAASGCCWIRQDQHAIARAFRY